MAMVTSAKPEFEGKLQLMITTHMIALEVSSQTSSPEVQGLGNGDEK